MGVQKTILQEGNGPSPKNGDRVTMEYTGWLKTASNEKGKQFDSTQGRGSFQTAIGVGRVIKGWDEGVVQMKLGEKARLDITSDYAYGDQYVLSKERCREVANCFAGSSPVSFLPILTSSSRSSSRRSTKRIYNHGGERERCEPSVVMEYSLKAI